MLILASGSPRRRELLAQAGYEFLVCPAEIAEEMRAGEDPIAYVTRLAQEKAEAVYARLAADGLADGGVADGGVNPGEVTAVLGADTTVAVEGEILGKPLSAEDAARMLRMLRGRTHRVITGVSVVTAERTVTAAEVTMVQFLTLSEAEIARYVASGEPMDKAGAYAIQGRAARWIPRIQGCYFNVVGLPIALTAGMLEAAGITSSL